MLKKRKNKNSFDKKKSFTNKFTINKPKEDEEINRLQSEYDSIDSASVKLFSDFPLSWKTLQGLKAANFKTPTTIQKESIGHALKGRDILGAAITGSGKTLAFLIPIMENLFLKKWTRIDGVGAIIISPTRELAYQIFETLKKVGIRHDFSAGLIIGGKNLKFERSRMDQCNIIICTPGRLLQHMDENPLFNASSMQILVLDEADRCLDMGFAQTMNGIIENLPAERQTLLFSATQTKSVKDLARLSLKDPIYVAPHEQQLSMPVNLQQSYVVVNLEDKITMLWSFVKNHLKQKCIVFLSSCKQVKYIYEIFCKLRPGTSLLGLYGTLHQDRRVLIYNEFCRKSNVVLFATDVASRGLDFPFVNWVVQLDCPEDVTQYIHRAGRTARHNARGESLLVLLPSEEDGMIDELKKKNITIKQIHIDPRKLFSPNAKIEAFLAQNQELKETAQRAMNSYLKSVLIMKNKQIFNLEKLDINAYAKSLGLVVCPRIRFLERFKSKKLVSVNNNKLIKESLSDGEPFVEQSHLQKKENGSDFNFSESSDDDDNGKNGLIKIKRKDHNIEESFDQNKLNEDCTIETKSSKQKKALTKATVARRVLKKKIIANKKVLFNEDGQELLDPTKHLQSDIGKEYVNQGDGGINIEMVKKIMREEDKFDKQRFKEIVKAKRKIKNVKLNKKGVDKEEQRDNFGESSDDLNDVDLSWLPDPDNIYNVKNSDTESDNEEDQVHHPPAKLYEKSKNKRSLVSSSCDSEDDFKVESVPIVKKTRKLANKLSVNEAEIIAMQLLGT